MFDPTGRRVWVAGHRGLVGSALIRRLEREPVGEIVTASSGEVDLRRQGEAERFVSDARPDVIFLAAGRVGGIEANRSAQGEFLYDNLMIGANVLEAARRPACPRPSSWAPRASTRGAPSRSRRGARLRARLDLANVSQRLQITTLELGKMYRRQFGMNVVSLMPTNLYGPGDDFDPVRSHVLAALLRKIHEAKVSGTRTVEVWGTGAPRREFLHVDDLADAALFALRNYEGENHLNVGTGRDITIRELAGLIAEIVGWQGADVQHGLPDGMPHKLLDVSRLASLGWTAQVGLRDGLEQTYGWYVESVLDPR